MDELYQIGPMICLSLDLDWAPAWATDWISHAMSGRGLTGTFFVTHECASLPTLRKVGMELGLHPNYLAGSSHGTTTAQVIDFVAAIVPEARGVRAHALVSSTPLWTEYAARGFAYESSDLLDGQAGLKPLKAWNDLVRLPIYWEDDVHLMHGRPLELAAVGLEQPGLKILNFHPVLLALNASSLDGYQGLKKGLAASGTSLQGATQGDFAPFVNTGYGLRDLFVEVCDELVRRPEQQGGRLIERAGTV
ncbi:MAG: hypothetical protein ACJAYU_002202 [Bradymonadia bacterium]